MTAAHYTTVADILANAGFTEDRERLELDRLTGAQRLVVRKSEAMGCRLVRVNWPDGATALMPIPPGAQLPHPAEIVRAYRAAKASGVVWPKVVQA